MEDISLKSMMKVEIDAWVKRLIKLGSIKDYENKKGGWFLFEWPGVDSYIDEIIKRFDNFRVTESPKEVDRMSPDQAFKAGQMSILLQIKGVADKLSQ